MSPYRSDYVTRFLYDLLTRNLVLWASVRAATSETSQPWNPHEQFAPTPNIFLLRLAPNLMDAPTHPPGGAASCQRIRFAHVFNAFFRSPLAVTPRCSPSRDRLFLGASGSTSRPPRALSSSFKRSPPYSGSWGLSLRVVGTSDPGSPRYPTPFEAEHHFMVRLLS